MQPMSKADKATPEPTKAAVDSNAFVALNEMQMFVDGKMVTVQAGEVMPPLPTPTQNTFLKSHKIVRASDYRGNVNFFPVYAPAPRIAATVVPNFGATRDEHGMVKVDLAGGLPGDDPTFRVDKAKPHAPTYIPPGHAVEMPGKPHTDDDGFTHVDWNPQVLRNNAPVVREVPTQTCMQCDGEFASYEHLKVHEAKVHATDSFHDHIK